MKRILVVIVLLLGSCVEELETTVIDSTGGLPDILIVEATLTNEIDFQEVRLSKLDSLLDLETDTVFNPFLPPRNIDVDLVNYEENALVQIAASNGTVYNFTEIDPGVYQSNSAFAAQEGVGYELSITRSSGQQFISDVMEIEGISNLTNLYAAPTISDSGAEGIGIFVDAELVSGAAFNLRYSYDETHKIIAPLWSPFEFRLTDYDPCALPVPTYNLEIVERTTEARVCYKTNPSNEIVQAQTDQFTNNGLEDFMVRFINKEDYIIANRYSIEVQQLVSSPEAYGFYEQLANFSRNESLFSAVQPGQLGGNISDLQGNQESVIGFFDVVSVSKQRLFLNWEDFFPGEQLPEYPTDCGLHSSPESHVSYCFDGLFMNDCPQSTIERIALGTIAYVEVNGLNLGTCPGPYLYVATPCGDCTRLGSNVVPDFWEE